MQNMFPFKPQTKQVLLPKTTISYTDISLLTWLAADSTIPHVFTPVLVPYVIFNVIFSPLESVHQRLLFMHFIDFKTNILTISYHVLCAANTRHSRHHNVTC